MRYAEALEIPWSTSARLDDVVPTSARRMVHCAVGIVQSVVPMWGISTCVTVQVYIHRRYGNVFFFFFFFFFF